MDVNYCWHNHTILDVNNKGRCAKTKWKDQMSSSLSVRLLMGAAR